MRREPRRFRPDCRECGGCRAWAAGQRAPAAAPRLRCPRARASTASSTIPPITRLMGVQHGAGAALLDLGRSGERRLSAAGRQRRPLRRQLHGGADGGGPLLPHHHDPRRRSPTLRHEPELSRSVLPKILSRNLRPALRSAAEEAAITIGMGMTEKQGGTDVRTNTTTAMPLRQWRRRRPIPDHRPQMVPVGAHVRCLPGAGPGPGGLSCFLMPRFLPDGRVNALRHRAAQGQARQPLQRLRRGGVPTARRPGSSARRAAAFPPSSRW